MFFQKTKNERCTTDYSKTSHLPHLDQMPRGKVRFRVEAGEEGDMRIGSRSGLFGPSPLEITMFSYPTDEICTQKIMLCLSQEEQVEPSRASAERPSLFGGQGSPGTQGVFGRSGY